MSSARARWTLALGYVAFIYLTLEIMPIPLRYLRSLGVLRLTLFTVYGLCFSALLLLLINRAPRDGWRYASLAGLSALYYLAARRTSSPEEQVHFLEYGLVGVFFLRALETKLGLSWRSFALAFALASLAGVVDELIQGIMPTRHYDVKDIFLNIVSAGLGLCIFAVMPAGRPAPNERSGA